MNTEPVPDLGIERLVHIDRRIDANESDAIRARWEFGHHMLAARDGMGRLPNGMRAELIRRTGKSAAELTYRMQLAERFPTEAELFTAVNSFDSWTDLRLALKSEKDAEENAVTDPQPAPLPREPDPPEPDPTPPTTTDINDNRSAYDSACFPDPSGGVNRLRDLLRTTDHVLSNYYRHPTPAILAELQEWQEKHQRHLARARKKIQ